MIVKLKCVDNEDYNYFTSGKIYEGKPCENKGCYYVVDDDGMQCIVSCSGLHGKWEVVK